MQNVKVISIKDCFEKRERVVSLVYTVLLHFPSRTFARKSGELIATRVFAHFTKYKKMNIA